MRKVDFLIAGTQKGGTTALDAYLRTHPELCMANRKEVHFFDRDTHFQQGTVDYSAYHAFFSPTASQRLLGEATPIYMYWHRAFRRIWEYNPRMKIIVMLRNPVERAYSHWNMERDRKAESLPFWEAIQREPERCREALPDQHRVYSYVDRGFYTEQLRRLWRYFPPEQTLILRHEALRETPQFVLDPIFDFLEVARQSITTAIHTHARPYVTTMSEREKAYLQWIYEYEIRSLERLLGWDCSTWLQDGNT